MYLSIIFLHQTIHIHRNISISREIIKRYEEVYRGNISQVIEEAKDAKGEFVIVGEGNTEIKSYDNLSVIEHVNLYLEEDMKLMDAIKKVAKERKIPKGEVYKEYHGSGM